EGGRNPGEPGRQARVRRCLKGRLWRVRQGGADGQGPDRQVAQPGEGDVISRLRLSESAFDKFAPVPAIRAATSLPGSRTRMVRTGSTSTNCSTPPNGEGAMTAIRQIYD